MTRLVRLGASGVQVKGYVGVREEERRVLRPLLVDLELQVEYDGSGELAGTVDLEAVLGVVEAKLRRGFRLLEDLAAEIAAGVLGLSPRVIWVRARVRKPLPPVAAHLEAEWAEVIQTRDGEGFLGVGGEPPT